MSDGDRSRQKDAVKYFPGQGEPPVMVELVTRLVRSQRQRTGGPRALDAVLKAALETLDVQRLALISGRVGARNMEVVAYATPQHLAHEALITAARRLGDDLPPRPDPTPRTVAGEGLKRPLHLYALPLFEGRREDAHATLIGEVEAEMGEQARRQLLAGLLCTRQVCERAWLADRTAEHDPRPLWEESGGAHVMIDTEGRIRAGFTDGARELLSPHLEAEQFKGIQLGTLLSGSSPGALHRALQRARLGTPQHVDVETLNGRTVSLLCIRMDPWVMKDGDVMVLCRDESVTRRLLQSLEYKERMAALGAATAGAAHEINNKLASTLTLLRLLGQPGLRGAERRQHREDLQAEVTRASELVSGLLDLAREWEQDFEPVQVGAVFQDLLALTGERRRESRVKTEIELPEDPPYVFANRAEVEQILRHLMANALDALEEAELPPGEIRRLWLVAREDEAGRVEIEVRDNAGGIPEDVENKIFDRFFTTRSEQGAAGIGLTAARTLADRNGGELRLKNESGEGARFLLTLPSIEPDEVDGGVPALVAGRSMEEAVEELEYRDLEALRDLNVLIVDDEPVLRSSLRNLLRLYSKALITEAATAEEARRAIEEDDALYDIILLDIRLPDQNGRQLYEELVEEYPGLSGRVIFVAGERIEGDLLSFFRAEGVPHIGKPFQPEVLLEAMLRVAGYAEDEMSN